MTTLREHLNQAKTRWPRAYQKRLDKALAEFDALPVAKPVAKKAAKKKVAVAKVKAGMS